MSPRLSALSILLGEEDESRLGALGSRRDRALAERLVSGVTKWMGFLDFLLAEISQRPLFTLSPQVKMALRMGVYQLFLQGTPPHAAVSSVVGCLTARGDRAYVNGVLRGACRLLGHVEMPSVDQDPVSYGAARFSYPPHIVSLFIERFGTMDAFRILSRGNKLPSISLRVDLRRTSVDALISALAPRGVSAEPSGVPGSITLSKGTQVTRLPGFLEGHFVVQDPAATIVGLVVGARPGERVWDVCAAPGGKATHMAWMMDDDGVVLATDKSPSRLQLVEESTSRLGLHSIETRVQDAERDRPPGEYDRILVDAPCSGLGVLGRNADARWNRRPQDILAQSKIQRSILGNVVSSLGPGGTLVYSTCTLTRTENEDVWLGFLREHPDLVPQDPANVVTDDVAAFFAGDEFRGPGYRYLLPHISGFDGFFVARAELRRKEGGHGL